MQLEMIFFSFLPAKDGFWYHSLFFSFGVDPQIQSIGRKFIILFYLEVRGICVSFFKTCFPKISKVFK